MTQEEIIDMARQSHLGVTLTHFGCVGQFIEGSNWTEEIEAFAKLVAAKEREACAKVCDTTWNGDADTYDYTEACNDCAEAIRERGCK